MEGAKGEDALHQAGRGSEMEQASSSRSIRARQGFGVSFYGPPPPCEGETSNKGAEGTWNH
jgi:hypothetical protein